MKLESAEWFYWPIHLDRIYIYHMQRIHRVRWCCIELSLRFIWLLLSSCHVFTCIKQALCSSPLTKSSHVYVLHVTVFYCGPSKHFILSWNMILHNYSISYLLSTLSATLDRSSQCKNVSHACSPRWHTQSNGLRVLERSVNNLLITDPTKVHLNRSSDAASLLRD